MASWPYPSSTQIASPSSAAASVARNKASIDGDGDVGRSEVEVDEVVKDDGSCDKARAVAVRAGGRAATGAAATTTAGFPPSFPLPLPLVLVLAEGGFGVM